jgi:hypothetical protein
MKTNKENELHYVYSEAPSFADVRAWATEYFGIHTPAPWVYDESGLVWKLRSPRPEKGYVIADVLPPTELDEWLDGQSPEVIEEWRQGRMVMNTRLIAAAPQLLNSLLDAYEKEEKLVAQINRLEGIIKEAARQLTTPEMRAMLAEGMSVWEQILLRKELNEEDE